jgi:hypothetical protein
VGILECEKQPVKVAFAFPFGFAKSGKAYINHAYDIIANLRVKLVGKRNILDNFVAALSEIRIKTEKTERIDYRNVVIVRDFLSPAFHFAFPGKVGYRHAFCLNHDSQDFRINRIIHPAPQTCKQTPQKATSRSKSCKSFNHANHGSDNFEIKRERGEPGLSSGLGIGNKRFCGHNTSFKRDKVNGNRILYKKSAIMPYVTCLNIENSCGGVKAKHYSICNLEAKQ